ncbi:hypothetical protein SlGVgp029 [Spodoptera litura granulovirus]|uniref:Chitin-binding type-2 domain-containing protein n=1 Tax=Spodoptera litura granulovirus TaxID=359919 RepID=A5IZN1_9BBAC|nr:hypothetical protein SlGVgp029 [Spodoptera litura granulovirus]ABQ51972.1 hypothetical protein SlGVgp029 [Spodoptera litura granulovirus]
MKNRIIAILTLFFVTICIIIILYICNDMNKDDDYTSDNDTISPDFYCPDNYFGNVPSLIYCDVFYLCSGGSVLRFFCGLALAYDVELKRCSPREFVDCGDRIFSDNDIQI